MPKIWEEPIYKTFRTYFQGFLDHGGFLKNRKIPTLFLFIKQMTNNKELKTNLSSFNMRKSFERLLCNNMLSFFIENKLIRQTQSGEFKLGNFCINQVSSIANETYKSFHGSWEEGVFSLICQKCLTYSGIKVN